MSYQFCCPQGHVLQGDPSMVGQGFQCPVCGSSFLVPPLDGGLGMTGGFMQGPPTWPTADPALGGFPPPGAMPSMPQPQGMPGMMPGLMPGFQGRPFGMPPAVISAGPAPASSEPKPAAAPVGAEDRPKFDLGFDPHARESLPFEMPGPSEPQAADAPSAPQAAAFAPAASASNAFLAGAAAMSAALPSSPFAAATPEAASAAGADRDFLDLLPAGNAPAQGAKLPKILHIRCPSGHLVKAGSELLGKPGRCPACKKTFELRYEDSVEFQRRTQKLLDKEAAKQGRAWIAWTFLAAFFLFALLIGVIILLSR